MHFDVKFSYKIIKVRQCAAATHVLKTPGEHCASLPSQELPLQGLQIKSMGFIISKRYWVQDVLAQEEKLTI